jgi:hypothetical protein
MCPLSSRMWGARSRLVLRRDDDLHSLLADEFGLHPY